jgi:hypothetical protein
VLSVVVVVARKPPTAVTPATGMQATTVRPATGMQATEMTPATGMQATEVTPATGMQATAGKPDNLSDIGTAFFFFLSMLSNFCWGFSRDFYCDL